MLPLYIDGDHIAYKCAFSAERQTNWGDGTWTWHAHEHEAIQKLFDWVSNIKAHCGSDELTFCLTGAHNWRKDILPTYKAHRDDKRKPLLLKFMVDYIMDNFPFAVSEKLEGDDWMGILQTRNPGIIVSIDKDMKTIPGKYCRDVSAEIKDIEPLSTFYWHMYQTLMGDKTDGYAGIPGCGPKTAEKILADKLTTVEMWEAVVKAYSKAGLGYDYALTMARVAFILTKDYYNTETEEVKLWTPPS